MNTVSASVRPVRLLLAALCALALLGTGCSRSIDRALADVTRSGDGIQHDRHGDQFTFQDDTFQDDPLPAAVVGAVDQLPADFPNDIYLPDDYRLLASGDRDTGLRLLQVRADGAASQLGDQARNAMLRHGWRQVMSRQRGDSQRVLAYVKGERTAVLVFDRVDLGEVQVAVQWRPAATRG